MKVDNTIIEDFQEVLCDFNRALSQECDDELLQYDAQMHAFVRCGDMLRALLEDIFLRNFSYSDNDPKTSIGIVSKLAICEAVSQEDMKWLIELFGIVELFVFDRLVIPNGQIKIQYQRGERLLPFFYDKVSAFVHDITLNYEVIDGNPWKHL